MKIIFFLIFFVSSLAQARTCTLDEIRRIDTIRVGKEISAYPKMTRATMYASVIPYIARLDPAGAENNSFWTLSFIGAAGMLYFGVKSFSSFSCDDDEGGRRYYHPSRDELLAYHRQQNSLFIKNYTWMGLWMAGVFSLSNYQERKIASVVALAVPWLFSLSGRWSAFSEESEMTYAFYPQATRQDTVMNLALSWNF